jgi:hypothetical protein
MLCPRLVGRDDELQAIQAALDATRTAHATVAGSVFIADRKGQNVMYYRDRVFADPREQRFHDRMCDLYAQIGKQTGYYANRFAPALGRYGGPEVARRLLDADKPQVGFGTMTALNMLDLSVEAVVLNPAFQSLFTAKQLATARRRRDDARGSMVVPRP